VDLVSNSYSFHFSLEQDSHEHTTKVTPARGGLLNSHVTSANHQTRGEDCHFAVPGDGHDLETLEESHNGIAAEMAGCITSNNQNGNLDVDCDGGNASSEGSLQNHSFTEKHINNSAATTANQPLYPATSRENGTLLVQHESLTAGNNEEVREELAISNNFSKSTGTQFVVPSGNGVHTAFEPETQNVEIGGPVSDQPLIVSSSSQDIGAKSSDVKSDKHENATDNNVSSSNSSAPAESGVICLYQCCPACLRNLHHLTKKMLRGEWGLNSDQWSVEDVHDTVASLSVDLISAVRKSFMAEDFIDSSNKSSRNENHGPSLDCLNLRTCNAESQDKKVVPAECDSHSATTIEDTALNEESAMVDLKFVFRDGVLVHMDPDKDMSVHCKFENLCLCSLRDLILMTKRPFG